MTIFPFHRVLATWGGVVGLHAFGAAPVAPIAAPDQAFKILQSHPTVSPLRALHKGILYGEARIAFHVDREGRMVDSLAVAYSARPFAEAALDALARWAFIPQRTAGQAGSSVVHLTVRFEVNGVVAIERTQPPSLEFRPDVPAGDFVYQPCAPAALDRPLRAVIVVPPDYPRDLRRRSVGGFAEVNFYVDEQGRPRMVVAAAGAHPALAALAIAAMEQWRFEPPTSGGKAVLVGVSQEFRFEAK
jgi:TonB family protein